MKKRSLRRKILPVEFQPDITYKDGMITLRGETLERVIALSKQTLIFMLCAF